MIKGLNENYDNFKEQGTKGLLKVVQHLCKQHGNLGVVIDSVEHMTLVVGLDGTLDFLQALMRQEDNVFPVFGHVDFSLMDQQSTQVLWLKKQSNGYSKLLKVIEQKEQQLVLLETQVIKSSSRFASDKSVIALKGADLFIQPRSSLEIFYPKKVDPSVKAAEELKASFKIEIATEEQKDARDKVLPYHTGKIKLEQDDLKEIEEAKRQEEEDNLGRESSDDGDGMDDDPDEDLDF